MSIFGTSATQQADFIDRLYLIIQLVVSIPSTFINLWVNDFEHYSIMSSILIQLAIAVIAVLLLFKADPLVRILKLEKGFDDERINLGKIKGENILKLAIIIIGGYILISSIPSFLNQSYFVFKDLIERKGSIPISPILEYQYVDYYQFSNSIISLFLGYLVITNSTTISKLLSKNDQIDE